MDYNELTRLGGSHLYEKENCCINRYIISCNDSKCFCDGNRLLYGLRTYGYDLYGGDDTRLGKVEYSGAESLYGYTGRFVRKHMY